MVKSDERASPSTPSMPRAPPSGLSPGGGGVPGRSPAGRCTPPAARSCRNRWLADSRSNWGPGLSVGLESMGWTAVTWRGGPETGATPSSHQHSCVGSLNPSVAEPAQSLNQPCTPAPQTTIFSSASVYPHSSTSTSRVENEHLGGALTQGEESHIGSDTQSPGGCCTSRPRGHPRQTCGCCTPRHRHHQVALGKRAGCWEAHNRRSANRLEKMLACWTIWFHPFGSRFALHRLASPSRSSMVPFLGVHFWSLLAPHHQLLVSLGEEISCFLATFRYYCLLWSLSGTLNCFWLNLVCFGLLGAQSHFQQLLVQVLAKFWLIFGYLCLER